MSKLTIVCYKQGTFFVKIDGSSLQGCFFASGLLWLSFDTLSSVMVFYDSNIAVEGIMSLVPGGLEQNTNLTNQS